MDNFDKLYNKALHFLSFRPRSEKEIREYLLKKITNYQLPLANDGQNIQTSEEVIDTIVNKLKDYKFLDDGEFARRWIEQRTKLKPKALKFIKFELKQKGITNEIIESVTTNDELPAINDLDMALVLAERRVGRLKNEPRQKKYEKMFRYLSSKGFDYDIIKQVIDRILPKEYNKSG